MLVKVERRFKGGFSVINSFTWSKLFEDTSLTGPRNHRPVRRAQARRRRSSVAPFDCSASGNFPIGRGKKLWGDMPKVLDAVIGGWELSGHYNIQSGVPVVFGTDCFLRREGLLPAEGRAEPRQVVRHFAFHPLSGQEHGYFNLSRPGPESRTCRATTTSRRRMTRSKTACTRTSPPTSARYPTRWGNVRASRTNELNMGIYKNFKITEGIKTPVPL